MSRPVTLSSAVEKSRMDSDVPYFILMELEIRDETGTLVNTIRAVRNDEDFYHKGKLYNSGMFDVSISEESGRLASATLRITDYTRAIRQQEEALGGPGYFKVKIYVVNSDTPNENPEISLEYGINGSSSQEYEISYSLGAENILSLPFPIHKQYQNRCRFRFKGKDCGYTGPDATCDLSLDGPNGCAGKNNTLRFGGFPGLG